MTAQTKVGIVPGTDASAETFGAFFLETNQALFGALWLVTRNRHEAEEIAQDA
ncbi:MAG: hypothetical protein ABI869_05745 [Actinomycetota bacterium]